MSADSVTGALVNVDNATLLRGMVVRVSSNSGVQRAQADSLAHLQGVAGVVNSGFVSVSGPCTNIVTGASRQYVLLETGLTPAAGDTLYISASVAGRATNVAPSNVFAIGTITDTRQYQQNSTVFAIVATPSSRAGAGTTTLQVANAAELAALPAASLNAGTSAYVTTLRCTFGLEISTQSTLALSRIAANGKPGHLWIRAWRQPAWWGTTAWVVDPANGSDENDGTLLPLQTFAELSRRWTGMHFTASSYTVTLLSDAPASDPLYLIGASTSLRTVSLSVVGTPTTIASRTMSAAHNPASTTDVDHYELTDVGASFGPWLQTYILHRTNSTSAWFWPYKDLGSGKLQISIPVDDGSTNIRPLAANDTYDVLSLPTFADILIHNSTRRISVSIQKVTVIGSTVTSGLMVPATIGPLLEYRQVRFQGTSLSFTGLSIGNQILMSNICMPDTVTTANITGHAVMHAGLYAGNGSTSVIETTGEILLLADSVPPTFGGRGMLFSHLTRVEKFGAMLYDWLANTAFNVDLTAQVYFIGVGGERNTGKLVTSTRGSFAVNVNSVNAAITSDPTPFISDGSFFSTLPTVTNTALNSLYQFPSVVFETGANTKLTFGSVADGAVVRRSGSALQGTTPTSLTGSRTDGTALNNLANILQTLGIVINNTTP